MNQYMQAEKQVKSCGLMNAVKIRLIRKYQRMEGNFDCCASAYVRVCKQVECLWRDECRKMTQD